MSESVLSNKTKTGRLFYLFWIGLALQALIAAFGIVAVRGQALRTQTSQSRQQAGHSQQVLVTPLVHLAETRNISLAGEIYGYYETPIYEDGGLREDHAGG